MQRYLIAAGLGLVLFPCLGRQVLSQPSTEPDLFLSPAEPSPSESPPPEPTQTPVQPEPSESPEPPESPEPSEQTTPPLAPPFNQTRDQPNNPLLKLHPRPSQFNSPSQAQDVEIDLTQPISLKQAQELAQRNNLDLQVVELQLQQSQANLKQARAARLPTVSVQGDLSRTDSSSFDLTPRPITVNAAAQNEVIGQTTQQLQQQQALTLQELQQSIQNLQLQLQQGSDQQQLVFSQQLQALQQNANTTLPSPFSITPLRPLTSFASSGQGSTGGSISNSLSGTLALTYNIFTSGSRSSQIRAARAQVRLAELTLQAQLEQLRLDVANDYYNLQETTALVDVAQSAVNNATQSLEDAQALERAGLGTFFDVLQAQVSLASVQQNLIQATSLAQVAQRQLAQRLNLPDTVGLSAANPVEAAGQWPLSLPQSIRLALQNRPELAQIIQQRRIAQLQRRAILASVRPQVQAFATVDFQDELDDSASGAFGYSVGAQVNWNFFDGGSAKAQATQQDKAIAITETQFASTKNALRFQVEQADSSLKSNFKNIEASSNTVGQAEESLRLARLRFQAGIGTQLDITTAQNDLTQAQGNLLSAILDYNRALATIQRATSYQQPIVPF
ncbi:MAG: TolC family protein [Thermosynechococcaceae cyanobacterium]